MNKQKNIENIFLHPHLHENQSKSIKPIQMHFGPHSSPKYPLTYEQRDPYRLRL